MPLGRPDGPVFDDPDDYFAKKETPSVKRPIPGLFIRQKSCQITRMNRPAFPRFLALLLLFSGLGLTALRAAPVDVGGTYEGEGRTVLAEPAYDGSVSLRALLALEFDHARGLRSHGGIAKVEVVQEERSLKITTKNADGRQEWTGEWARNGGFQATEEGVKFLIRTKREGGELFMFTLSPAADGAAMTVKIQRIENTNLGPVGFDVGTFLFLRTAE